MERPTLRLKTRTSAVLRALGAWGSGSGPYLVRRSFLPSFPRDETKLTSLTPFHPVILVTSIVGTMFPVLAKRVAAIQKRVPGADQEPAKQHRGRVRPSVVLRRSADRWRHCKVPERGRGGGEESRSGNGDDVEADLARNAEFGLPVVSGRERALSDDSRRNNELLDGAGACCAFISPFFLFLPRKKGKRRQISEDSDTTNNC
jgi:hypothetical protein